MLFRPEHLYISHVFIYAIKPEHVHHCQIYQLRAQPNKKPDTTRILSNQNFDPLSKFLSWSAMASIGEEEEEHPL
eukprot:9383164-Lingulodinium_polyedra.AAC.1